jgi:hypothetical protein
MPLSMGRRRRLLRILLNAATAASLVLCVTAVGLWARSYSLGHNANSRTNRMADPGRFVLEEWWFASAAGGVTFCRSTFTATDPRSVSRYAALPPRAERTFRRVPNPDAFKAQFDRTFLRTSPVAGFGYRHSVEGSPGGGDRRVQWAVAVPLWAPAALFAFAPAISVWRACRRRRRRHTGLCPACGYDLRATPDRCPECGAASTAASA